MREKILDTFRSLEIDQQYINDQTELENELGMDSQELIELHCALEKTISCKLPTNFISKKMTFGKLVIAVESYLQTKGAVHA